MSRTRWLLIVLVAIALAAAVILWTAREVSAPARSAPPAQFPSALGLFNLSYRADDGAIPLNELHTWTIHVEDADGQPVSGARISVDGRMPAHGHGLPTQPAVTADLGGGDYRVEGLRFQMVGEWVLDFTIQAGGQTDTAAVSFTLR
jgi:hypothetical protein